MKRLHIRAIVAATAVAAAAALIAPAAQGAPSQGTPAAPPGTLTWNGADDRAVSVDIDATASTRENASGAKITSNAHSADFPGIYFVWDAKQKDAGYLKVDAAVFDQYDSFTLTIKESNTYWDFVIAPQPGQQLTDDGCYVFFIPKVFGNKNINMVFVSSWVAKTPPPVTPPPADLPVVNVAFIACYVKEGRVQTTSIGLQTLSKPGDEIDWAAVKAAYADYAEQGGLERAGDVFQSSGVAPLSFTFGDPIVYGDLTDDQIENYYKTWYLDPGCKTPEVVVSYERYRAYVELWNDIYLGKIDGVTDEEKSLMSASGGLAHYHQLLEYYGADSLPPYVHFDLDMQDVYDHWADQLEPGLLEVCKTRGIDLNDWVIAYQIKL